VVRDLVGSGLYGATMAQQLHNAGKSVFVIDKRHHIRGYEIEIITLRAQEKMLIDNYRKLTEEGQKVVSANVSLLANGVA
jgi:2-polyprenyl-6-methoxyphenol hydroxylase-like FAD-dependent oxidoreductase